MLAWRIGSSEWPEVRTAALAALTAMLRADPGAEEASLLCRSFGGLVFFGGFAAFVTLSDNFHRKLVELWLLVYFGCN